MSRYEEPEGTGGYPAEGLERRGPLRRRGGSDDADWGASGPSGRGHARSGRPDAGRGPGRRGVQPVSRAHRILGRHPVLSVLAILATLTVTFVSLSAYAAYRNVYDSIHHENVTARELGKRPPKLNGSENILIIGSDSRAGTHGQFGRGVQGSRSDTSMILHIPPTHTGAVVVSFPRDTMVPIYGCVADGNGHPGQQEDLNSLEQLNTTFSNGGAPCLWRTLEQEIGRAHV